MNAFPRALPFALVMAAAAFAADAPNASELPPIFLPWNERVAPTRADAGATPRKPSSLSEHTRRVLNAKIAAIEIPATAVPSAASGASGFGGLAMNDATMMRAFVVQAQRLPPLELSPPDPPLWYFIKSGEFYQKGNTTGYFGLRSIESRGLTPKESTRLTISFTIKW